MKWFVGILSAATVTAVAFAVRAAIRRLSIPGPGSRVFVDRGVLYGPGGVMTPITRTDLLWLGRAIVGETGGRSRVAGAAVTWALAQNLMLVIGTAGRPRFSSFTAIVRAYCQPVNPAWATPGAGKCLQRPSACTESHIARRRRISSMTWSSLPAETVRVIEDFAAGGLENPVPGATDWAAYEYPGGTMNIEGNWFGVSRSRRLV